MLMQTSGLSSVRNTSTLDPGEVERFARLAAEWWDPDGKFRPLHELGPARLAFIREAVVRHFARDATSLTPLEGLAVLDIGCGGGLVSEPVRRMGARVTGIEPALENIAAARAHAEATGLSIDYRSARVEDLAAAGERYDCVLCLEVIEHVPDVGAFLGVVAQTVKPGGLLVLSTINRTLKAYALAIIGAEYVLRWLPVGTHQWERFVTPDEMARHLANAGFSTPAYSGLVYDPLADGWSLSKDCDVNYMASTVRPIR